MQAARRPRVDADEDEDEKPQVDQPNPVSVARTNGEASSPNTSVMPGQAGDTLDSQPALSPMKANSATTGEPTSIGTTVSPSGVAGAIVPVASRKPEEPLNETARAARSAENMKRIGEALILYCKENNRFPLPAIKSSGGLPTLSWRVELLPWLGYGDLYKQFDPNQPWDSPANKRLLEMIPDCYVSPERFDTNTNYLGISGRAYLFNGEPIVLRKIEDGLDNTLAIVEVNESASVPWTCPEDYVFQRDTAVSTLGGLRPGGSYALWANGWLTLLRDGISEELLHKAFTYESGDGIVAPEIHQPIRFSGVVENQTPQTTEGPSAEPSSGRDSVASANPAPAEMNGPAGTGNGVSSSASAPAVREPVPPESELLAARERIEPIFAPRFREAKDLAQRKQIAKEMLDAALTMTADPAGAFALQTASIESYASMGQFDELLNAVDAQVVRFDVDAIKTNTDALVLFARKNNSALAAQLDNRAFLRRFAPVAILALGEDLYDPLLEIIPAAIAIENQQRQRSWIADLNRLKQQLTSARNQYRQLGDSMDQLRLAPTDPQANYLVGRYVAFIRGDWQTGLPLLSLGNNERLAAIATLDLATPSNPTAMLKTADHWWELGESTNNDLFKGSCHQRAAHWYRSAHEQLPESLERLHAKAKLEDCKETGGGSPKATLESIAEKLGVQLEPSIARILNPAQRRLTQEDIDP